MMKKTLPQEHGQSILIIALLMVGLIAMMGLIFDGGNAYFQRRRMQNAVDAGALAGGRALALQLVMDNPNDYPVQKAVNDYVQANGGGIENIQAVYVNAQGTTTGIVGAYGSIPPNTRGISVTESTAFQTYFLNALNVNIGNVSAAALVMTGQPEPNNLWPMTVQTNTLTSGTPQTPNVCSFKPGADLCQIWGQGTGPGSLQWQSFKICDTSANFMTNVLAGNQTSGTVSVGDWICTSTGTMATAKDYLPSYIDKEITIPIYDYTNGLTGSNLEYHVVGFAKFYLRGYWFGNGTGQSDGNTSCGAQTQQYICAQFITTVDINDVDPNVGCQYVKYGYCSFGMQQ
jgi:Flp pilus assembly protein TadG